MLFRVKKIFPLVVILTLLISLAVPLTVLAQDGGSDPAPAGASTGSSSTGSEGGTTAEGSGSSEGDPAAASGDSVTPGDGGESAPGAEGGTIPEGNADAAEPPAAELEQVTAASVTVEQPAANGVTGSGGSAPSVVEEEAAAGTTAEPVAEVVAALEAADALLVNPAGDVVSLASQEAAQVLAAGTDPYFDAGGGVIVGYSSGAGCAAIVTECHAGVGNPIQQAIDDSRSVGKVINIEAGNYNEDVTINRNVTLNGVASGGLVDAIVRSFTLNVDISGWNHVLGTNIFVNSGAQIQDGINIVNSGGTVQVGAGTFNENLTINKSMTLSGSGEGSTIISPPNTGTYSIYVTANNVALKDFTVARNPVASGVGSYGLKIGSAGKTMKYTNILVDHVTVTGPGRTGIDLNGIDGATLSNLTVTGVTYGNGVSLTDTDNATLSNLMTNNPAGGGWGGLAIYASGKYAPGGSNNVVLTGTNIFAETNKVFVQNENGFKVTNFTAGGFSNAFGNPTGTSTGYTWYTLNQNDAVAGALALPNVGSSYVYQLNGGKVEGANFYVAPGLSIQAAINQAAGGETINVGAGTYNENIKINKSLTLLGATANVNKNGYVVPAGYAWDDTLETILNPLASTPDATVVSIDRVSDVTFAGFIVQALGRGASGDRELLNINAQTKINNIQIVNNVFGPNTCLGCQDGNKGRFNIDVNAQSSGPNGMTNSVIEGNKVFEALGNGANIFVIGTHYTPNNLSDFTGTVIRDNEIAGANRSGIELAGGLKNLSIIGNDIHDNRAQNGSDPTNVKYGNGILMIRTTTGTKAGDPAYTDANAPSMDNITITGNNIYNNGANGIYMGPMNRNHTITLNNIYGNGWNGVVVDLEGTYYSPNIYHAQYGSTSNITLSDNRIVGNSLKQAVVFGTPTNGFVLNANNNWWGSNAAPVDIAGVIDTTTWLKLGLDPSKTTIATSGTATLASKMYASGDASRSARVLGWFNPADVVVTEQTSLGSLAGNTFIAGTLPGTATFAGTYDTLNNDLASIIITERSPSGGGGGGGGGGGDGGDGGLVPPPAGGPLGPTGGIIPVTGAPNPNLIPVTGSNPVQLNESGTTALVLPDGTVVTITGMGSKYKVVLTSLAQADLPKTLEDGTFVAGVSLTILDESGKPLDVIPDGASITYTFPISSKFSSSSFNFLTWDEMAGGGTGDWNSTVPGQPVDGMLNVPMNAAGTFVVTAK